jgi:hypothetical protein
MKRLLILSLLLAFRSGGFGQAAPELPATAITPKTDPAPIFSVPQTAPVPPAPATTRPRETSPETAAKIIFTLPKYSAPPEAEAKKTEEAPDLRETDKPRNGIVRLPKYLVQEPKVPAFKDRELLTTQGKIDLAYKRHPGLRLGSLGFLNNNGPALMMLEEERRLERKAEMEDLYGLYQYSDPKAGAAVKRETSTTFIRHDGP